MKTVVCPLLVRRQAGRETLRPFCPLHESDRLEDTGSCVLSEMIDQSREDRGSQETQEEPRLLSGSGQAEREGPSRLQLCCPGWKAGLSAVRGCDGQDPGLEQSRGQKNARNSPAGIFKNP